MTRGPYCPACAHEYRSKDGVAENSPVPACPYCGSPSAPVAKKPFVEVSKSAIESYGLPGDPNGCPARFYFKRIMHRPEPKNPYAEFGIYGHSIAEAWIKKHELPIVNALAPKSTESRAALSLLGGIPHMPPPTLPGVQAEVEFHFGFEGVRYMGYKDVWAPLSETNETRMTGPHPPNDLRFGSSVVGDWKFVGNFKYVPHPEKLATDLQATIEAYDDIRRGATDVHLNWVYMPRGERAGKPVRALVHADTVFDRMRQINATAREVSAVLQSPPPSVRDMRTNASACRAYNQPCPHVDVCHVSQSSIFANAFEGISQSPTKESYNTGEKIMQGFPGSPGFPPPQPGALDALVAGLNGSQAPAQPAAPQEPFRPQATFQAPPPPAPYNPAAVNPPAFAPMQPPPPAAMSAPAAPAPPPPPAPVAVAKEYTVEWQGQRYNVPTAQVQSVIDAGGTVVGPVSQPAAPQTPPTVAAQAPAPTAAPPARATRGKRTRTAAPVNPSAPAPVPAYTVPVVPQAPPAAALAPAEPLTEEYSDSAEETNDVLEAIHASLQAIARFVEIIANR